NWASALFAKAEKVSDVTPILKSMGVPWADRDHHRVVELALELNQLVKTHNTLPARVPTLLREIATASEEHFAREEVFFQQMAYSGLVTHSDKHRLFMKEIHRYTECPETWNKEDMAHFQVQLLHWWLNHINGVDYHDFSSLTAMREQAS
ncbi:MAG: hemerythrin family protein, partial [Magnetococcales bacterium]|nr:hemerythrin family protein [Magnetococcales bacterium]